MIQSIIDKSGNNWMGFPFLFALCMAASLLIWFGINVETGRKNAERWANDMRKKNEVGKGIPMTLLL